jgi:membrane-bound lytic murein transglycosylase B
LHGLFDHVLGDRPANYLKNHGWKSGQPWTEGSANFDVLQKWNESEVYAKTVAYFAIRLEKEP